MRIGPTPPSDNKLLPDDGESKTPQRPLPPRSPASSSASHGPGTPRNYAVGLVAASARARAVPEQGHVFPSEGGPALIGWVASRKFNAYKSEAHALSSQLKAANRRAEDAKGFHGSGPSFSSSLGAGKSEVKEAIEAAARDAAADVEAMEDKYARCLQEWTVASADLAAARTLREAHPHRSLDALVAHLQDMKAAVREVLEALEEEVYTLRRELVDLDTSSVGGFTPLDYPQEPPSPGEADAFARLDHMRRDEERYRGDLIEETRVAQAKLPSHNRVLALKELEDRGALIMRNLNLTRDALHHLRAVGDGPAVMHVAQPPHMRNPQ